MTDVKNFIPYYPDSDDPKLIEKLSKLKEFDDLRLTPSEVIPNYPGTPLTHQELQARYFAEHTPYAEGIIWHGLGTGKCILPGTFVETSIGSIMIEKIWQNHNSLNQVQDKDGGIWSKPDTNIKVVSYNEKTKKIEHRSVKNLYRQFIDEDIVKITLNNGDVIEITKAHHLYNGMGWTNKFYKGDSICVSEKLDFSSLKNSNIYYSSVADIEIKRYCGWVYDLEIGITHNYFANNILCHNTCTASLIIERFKKTMVDGKPRRPALVIVKNSHLRESFRNEIARVCTRDIYLPSLRKDELRKLEKHKVIELSEDSKRRRLNAAIAKTYTILTVGELLDKKNIPNETIITREYSNRIIIIDEVHNIRVQPSKRERTQYESLHKFLHVVKNCRILLLTATPIWDKVYDIASLLNLLLPMEEQLPVLEKFTKEFFTKDGDLLPEKISELKEKMHGRISYLRPLISSAVRNEIGVKEPWLKYVKVYPSMMSDFQSTIAEDAKSVFGDGEITDAFMSNARDAVNCIYPIIKDGKVVKGEYGTKAFSNYAIVKKNKWIRRGVDKFGKSKTVQTTYDDYQFRDLEMKKALGPSSGPDPLSNLRRYATKFATLIDILCDPNRLNEKVFIYSDSVKGTGGVISLALILQLYGFRWIKNPDSIPRKGKKVTVDNPGSFVVITSDDQTISDPAQIRRTLQQYNRDDNIYGDRIRIIIGSQTIAQGHTLKATRQGHVMMPHWNLPGIDQAMGRIYRAGSFDQLPESERFVNFYRHVAISEGDEDDPEDKWVKLPPGVSEPNEGVFSTENSVDTHIYGIAEIKEHFNSQIYRIMKEVSWDCALTYARNVLVSDTDDSRECDFVECNYKCDNYPEASITMGPAFLNGNGNVWSYKIPRNQIDSSNYNLLYSSKSIKYYIAEIQRLFRSYFVLRFDMLIALLGEEAEKEIPIVLHSLNSIINHRILIKNRYGFASYLKEDRDTYFLDGNVSAFASYPTSIYTIFPFVTERSTLEDSVEVIQLDSDKEKISNFIKDPSVNSFKKISYRSQIIMLEKTVELRESGKDNKILDIIWKIYGREIYTMKDGNLIHNMYNSKYTGAGYNVFTKDLKANGKMRVFDRYNLKWDYVIPKDEEEYIEEVKELVSKRLKSGLEDNPYNIYGTTDKSRKFKIFDDREGKGKTGRVCMTSPATDLWNIFHHLDHLPYDDEVSEKVSSKKKKELLILLKEGGGKDWRETPYMAEVDNMSTKKLRKFYTMLTMSKSNLCSSLERWFKGENPEERNLFIRL